MLLGLTLLLGVVAVALNAARWHAATTNGVVGIDYDTFLAFARRFLDTGSMYLPFQTAGPFDPEPLPHVPPLMPSMYPPTAVWLFTPFLVLPAALWWAIPLGLLGWCVMAWRPATWTWPVLVAILAFSQFTFSVYTGNTVMWMAAFVAAALRWGWGGPLVLLKPSLAPFMLIGIRRRAWWASLAVLGVLSVPLLGQWVAYVDVVRNVEMSLWYSVPTIPVIMFPVIAWLGRQSPRMWPSDRR